MSDDEKWVFIEKSIEDLKNQYDIFSDIIRTIKIEPESPLCEIVYRTGQALVDSLSIIANDTNEFIDWYVNECDFGRKAKEAGCKDKMILIDNVKKLREVIGLVCK